jgi:glycosyltransferase involved in cell wall biosynthesis
MPSHPLTVLEAMTVGKVVVTSRVGAITKIIKDGENGLLVDDPRNPTEIAEKILKALNDPELRAKIGANAKKTIEQFFQWKDLASSFYEIHLNAHLNLEETTFKSSHQQTESENFVAI